jgi:prevent-host-death family protein
VLTVNIYEAKTHLSDLVEKAAQGEEIVIAKAGTPRARLVPIPTEPRKPGCWKGKVWIAEDFDEPLPAEMQKYFEGEDDFDWDAK